MLEIWAAAEYLAVAGVERECERWADDAVTAASSVELLRAACAPGAPMEPLRKRCMECIRERLVEMLAADADALGALDEATLLEVLDSDDVRVDDEGTVLQARARACGDARLHSLATVWNERKGKPMRARHRMQQRQGG